MHAKITITYINKDNKQHYKQTVLRWLKADFEAQENPQQHFWNNRKIIASAFDKCNALVTLDENNQNKFVSYMIWSNYKDVIEVDIIEVRKKYRRQGIFRKMLSIFSEKFPDVLLLSACVLPQSEEAFRKLGWQDASTKNSRGFKQHYKILKPGLEALDVLPNGFAIAVCSNDYYQVKNSPDDYKQVTKYFGISVDENKKLHQPIITNFHYEGYIGIYLNKKLIANGKAKHLFKNNVCHENLLVINKIIPENPSLFKELFSQLKQETNPYSNSISNMAEEFEKRQRENEHPETMDKELIALPPKRQKQTETPGISDFFASANNTEVVPTLNPEIADLNQTSTCNLTIAKN